MDRIRWIGWVGLVLGLATLGVGVLLVAGSALIAGDWWLARQPWIGLGLKLVIVGLVATAIFAVVRVVVEPIGWLRLLAVPPAAVAALGWFYLFAVGPLVLTRVGAPRPEPDPIAILYTLPELLVIAILVTLLIPLPLLIARIRSGPRGGASTTP